MLDWIVLKDQRGTRVGNLRDGVFNIFNKKYQKGSKILSKLKEGIHYFCVCDSLLTSFKNMARSHGLFVKGEEDLLPRGREFKSWCRILYGMK